MKKILLSAIRILLFLIGSLVLYNIFVVFGMKIFQGLEEKEYRETINSQNSKRIDDDITELLKRKKICKWAKSDLQRNLCMKDKYKKKDEVIKELFTRAINNRNYRRPVRADHKKWIATRNLCYSESCMDKAYGERIRDLGILIRDRQLCGINHEPVVLYREGFTANERTNAPVSYYTEIGPETRDVRYYAEVLGGKGNTVYHTWYKDGTQVARTKFSIDGEVWPSWSSYVLDSRNAVWEVIVEDSTGCLLAHDSITLSNSTVVSSSTLVSDIYSPTHYLNSIISEYDHKQLEILEKSLSINEDNNNYFYSRNSSGDTPLLLAIRTNNFPAVKLLLEMGASPYIWDASGHSALQLANELKYSYIEDLLQLTLQQSTPPWGVLYSHVEKIGQHSQTASANNVNELALSVKGVTRTYGLKGRNIRHEWGVANANGDLIKFDEASMSIDSNEDDVSSTFVSLANDTPWEVRVYLDDKYVGRTKFKVEHDPGIGSILHPYPRNPSTSKHLANLAQAGAPLELFAHVHGMDENPNHKTYDEIIITSAKTGNISIIKYLFGKGELSDHLYNGKTLVHYAVIHQHHDLLHYLLSLGMAQDQHDDESSDTPLHLAARLDDEVATHLLLINGAKNTQLNKNGLTPLQVSLNNCSLRSGMRILKAGEQFKLLWNGRNTIEELLQVYDCHNEDEWKDAIYELDRE